MIRLGSKKTVNFVVVGIFLILVGCYWRLNQYQCNISFIIQLDDFFELNSIGFCYSFLGKM